MFRILCFSFQLRIFLLVLTGQSENTDLWKCVGFSEELMKQTSAQELGQAFFAAHFVGCSGVQHMALQG